MKKNISVLALILFFSFSAVAQKHIKLMNKGVDYLQKGNMNMAIEYLNKSIAKKNNYYLSYFNRAVVFFDMGDSTKMKSDLDNALRLMPNDYDCLELYARHYYRSSNNELALDYANKALQINPSGYIALLISGEIYAVQQDFIKAENRIEKAFKLADEPCRIAPYLGSIKTLLNKQVEAKSYFDQCRSSVFYSEDYKMREALYYFRFNEDEKGDKLIQGIEPAGIKNKSFIRIFYFYEGVKATESKQYLRAITLYNTSQQYEEKQEPQKGIFLNRSICYMNLGEYQSALTDINTYLTYHKSDTAFKNKSLILERMGDSKGANRAIHEAIRINQEDENLYLKSSNLFVESNEEDSALSIINKGIAASPQSGVLYYQKAWLSRMDISYKDYMSLIDSCLKYDLSFEQAVRAKTMYFLQTDQVLNANKLLTKAYAEGLDTASYYVNKSVIYGMQDNDVMAIKSLKKSLEYDSLNMDALYYLARAYEDEGSFNKALEYYKLLISALPDGYSKGEYYRSMAKIYTLQKKSGLACSFYKKAIEQGEKIPAAMLKLNNCK